MTPTKKAVAPVLGLRANAAQFTLLVAVNALVGGMLGQERTVLPLLATDVFGLDSYTAALTYILAFGLAIAFGLGRAAPARPRRQHHRLRPALAGFSQGALQDLSFLQDPPGRLFDGAHRAAVVRPYGQA